MIITSTFGIIGDTHIGSKSCDWDALEIFYKECLYYGVDTVFHCGDFLDGKGMFNSQDKTQEATDLEDQINLAIDRYPRVGIKTKVIYGNHDSASRFLSKHEYPLDLISEVRDDIEVTRDNSHIFNINNCNIKLYHPSQRSNSRTRDSIEEILLKNDDTVDIFAVGHTHKSGIIPQPNVRIKGYFITPGCFLGESRFSNQSDPSIGGYIVQLSKCDDDLINIENKWIGKYGRHLK